MNRPGAAEMNCDEVLDQVYEYLDGELDRDRIAEVRRHLEECGPCLQQFGLEQAVRELVARSCACSRAPDGLRDRILSRITEIRISAASVDGSFTVRLSAYRQDVAAPDRPCPRVEPPGRGGLSDTD